MARVTPPFKLHETWCNPSERIAVNPGKVCRMCTCRQYPPSIHLSIARMDLLRRYPARKEVLLSLVTAQSAARRRGNGRSRSEIKFEYELVKPGRARRSQSWHAENEMRRMAEAMAEFVLG